MKKSVTPLLFTILSAWVITAVPLLLSRAGPSRVHMPFVLFFGPLLMLKEGPHTWFAYLTIPLFAAALAFGMLAVFRKYSLASVVIAFICGLVWFGIALLELEIGADR